MKANPAIIEEERAKRNLLADQPKELLEEVVPFYTEGTKEGIFSTTGGGIEAAKADFDFYTEAGQMKGPASSLQVEEFWDLRPLDAATQKLGLSARRFLCTSPYPPTLPAQLTDTDAARPAQTAWPAD